MQPRFFIYCYSGDAGLLPGRVDNIRWVYPDAHVHIIDDASNPIPATLAHELDARPAVHYEQSTWPRGGNLNGETCVRGMLDTYARHACLDDVIVKTDPDALFIDRERVHNAIIGQGYGYIAAQVANYMFGGYFYAVRADVLAAVRRSLPAAGMIMGGQHEDITIGCLGYMCAMTMHYPCDILLDRRLGGVTGAYDHRHQGDALKQYLDELVNMRCVMLTLGNPDVSKAQALASQQAVLARLAQVDIAPPAPANPAPLADPPVDAAAQAPKSGRRKSSKTTKSVKTDQAS